MRVFLFFFCLSEMVNTFNVDVVVLHIQLLTLCCCSVEPFPTDCIIVRASGFTPGVHPPQRCSWQLGGYLPNLTPGVVTEKVQLLGLVKVHGGQKSRLSVIQELEISCQVGHSIWNLAFSVHSVENLCWDWRKFDF